MLPMWSFWYFWIFRTILSKEVPIFTILGDANPHAPVSCGFVDMANIFEKENMCQMGAKLNMPKCAEKISGSFGICDF